MSQITRYFTFGQNYVHRINGRTFDCDCVVEITDVDPREVMFATFSDKWAMEYSERPNMNYFPRGIIKLA